MSREEALRAVAAGLDAVTDLRASGIDIIGIGDMGIGNTTAASAVVAVMAGAAPVAVTGHGTGIDDATHRRKVAVIERAIARNAPDPADPIGVLAAVGGLEIGALVGVILGAVAVRVPMVLDGFITGASALLAADLAPRVAERVIAAHRSVEPGHAIVLDRLGLRPILDLDLRLGEGTGAALAIQLIDAAMRVRDGMATFTSAAVSGPADGGAQGGRRS
jgi:nicotinate-nucleotide--dimethylbenzimidazole phosphoribosyltransferase